jgi:glucosamine kinase
MKGKILIADSGSTKTDWVLINNGRKRSFNTQGLHPYLQTTDEIYHILSNELKIDPKRNVIDEIHFFGAGISSVDSKKRIEKALKQFFPKTKVASFSDLMAAARATCGHEKGIACILGTGSNSCYYNGKNISTKQPSLGYLLGDEGSGNHMGKKVLQYYFHGLFDKELKQKFDKRFELDLETVLNNVYRKSFPNRYLAQFASFVFENRGHYLLENIAEDALNDFFINHLLQYKNIHKLPVHFSGSVAYSFQDVIAQLCEQYEIALGNVVQRPMQALVSYYSPAKV